MKRGFENELHQIKAELLQMGSYVEKCITNAIEGLHLRDTSKIEEVHTIEKLINKAHKDIDHHCLEILARLSPVAADLRLILSVIKINTDLERMGDQAVNIALNTKHYISDKIVDISLDLPKMSQLVQAMVRDSLDAFMNRDVNLAHEVLKRDDAVDDIKRKSLSLIVPYMQNNPQKIQAALDLILITRNLERMGDHATNIAEDVIFAYTGEDIRHSHHGLKQASKK